MAQSAPRSFQICVLTLWSFSQLLGRTAFPLWSPLLVLIGFVLFAVNLDLIPIGALLILAGLATLAGDRRPEPG